MIEFEELFKLVAEHEGELRFSFTRPEQEHEQVLGPVHLLRLRVTMGEPAKVVQRELAIVRERTRLSRPTVVGHLRLAVREVESTIQREILMAPSKVADAMIDGLRALERAKAGALPPAEYAPKACPFCGSLPEVEPQDPSKSGSCWGQVACVNEGCPAQPVVRDGLHVSDNRGPTAYKRAAIERWNRRA